MVVTTLSVDCVRRWLTSSSSPPPAPEPSTLQFHSRVWDPFFQPGLTHVHTPAFLANPGSQDSPDQKLQHHPMGQWSVLHPLSCDAVPVHAHPGDEGLSTWRPTPGRRCWGSDLTQSVFLLAGPGQHAHSLTFIYSTWDSRRGHRIFEKSNGTWEM